MIRCHIGAGLAVGAALSTMTSWTCAGGTAECCTSGVRINEIRTGHPGPPQNNEYVELAAQPGALLDCMFYIVIGPGGVVEELIGLAGSVGPSGLFLIAQPDFDPGAFPGAPSPDLVTPLNFLDNGNRTHLLVCDCGGLAGIDEGSDLDVDNNGMLDVTPWDCVLDCIALVQFPAGAPVYCPITRGPTPTGNAPAHVYRCTILGTAFRPWRAGPFSLPPTGLDTPDTPNPACVAGPVFAGLLHEPLGAATLSEVAGTLLVTGLDTLAGSGVAIDLGVADALCVETNIIPLLMDPECGGEGAPFMVLQGLTPSGAPALTATYSCVGQQQLGLSVQFGMAPGAVDISLRAGGVEVAAATGVGPLPGGLPPVIITWEDVGGNNCGIINDINDHGPSDLPGGLVGLNAMLEGLNEVSIMNGVFDGIVTVKADQIVIRPSQPMPSQGLSRVEITGAGFGTLPITGELLREFGNPHTAIGDVHMLAGGEEFDEGLLELRALPNADAIGARIGLAYGPTDLPEVAILGIIVRPLELGPIGDGASLTLAPAVVNGGVATPLGSLSYVDAGEGTQLIADFAPLGVPEMQWQGWNGGSLVGTIPVAGPQATLALSAVPFQFYTYKLELDQGANRLYLRKCLLFPVVLPQLGGIVDEIVLCLPAPQPYDPELFGMELDLVTSGIPAFAIVEETPIFVKLVQCPADLDGSGVVDGADLGLQLANWGAPGDGDLDQDGTTDGADLGLLLAAWGPCP
jgi:hypothetical protein